MTKDSYASAALGHRQEMLNLLAEQDALLSADLETFESLGHFLSWIDHNRDALSELLGASPSPRAKLLAKLPPREKRLHVLGAAYLATEAHHLLAALYQFDLGLSYRSATANAAKLLQEAGDAGVDWLAQSYYIDRWR